jgi:hypothetical protein
MPLWDTSNTEVLITQISKRKFVYVKSNLFKLNGFISRLKRSLSLKRKFCTTNAIIHFENISLDEVSTTTGGECSKKLDHFTIVRD